MKIDKETYKNQQLILNNLQGKIQFFSEALHHLNDPLTALTGAVELIKKSAGDKKLPNAEQIDIIERSSESLRTISRRVLAIIEDSFLESKDIPGNWIALNAKDRSKEKTILVVDDDDDVRNIMTALLNNMGYAVMLATNGEQGIVIASEHYFDLIISDINMPKKDGVEFVHEVKAINPWVPILIITGFQKPEASELTKQYESVGLLNKPFNQKDLKDIIQKIFA